MKVDLQLVDQLGLLDAEIKKLEEQKSSLRAVLFAELLPQGGGTVEGNLFTATVRNSARSYLDKEKLAQYVEASVLRKCTKVTSCASLSVKRRA